MARITITIVQLSLVATIALLSMKIGTKLRRSADLMLEVPPTVQTEEPSALSPSHRSDFTHYRSIAERNLFQTMTGTSAGALEIDLSELKPTDLQLKLWGTITGTQNVQRAVIEDTVRHRQLILREHEGVAAAQVRKILRDKVILSVNGEHQILEMQKPASGSGRSAARQSLPPSPSAVSLPDLPEVQARKPTIRIRLRPELRHQLAAETENWETFATTTVVEDENGDNGLLIERLTGSSLLRRLGIHNGDIVLRIDDEPIASLDEIGAHFRNAEPDAEITMQLKRRDIVRDMTIQRQLAPHTDDRAVLDWA